MMGESWTESPMGKQDRVHSIASDPEATLHTSEGKTPFSWMEAYPPRAHGSASKARTRSQSPPTHLTKCSCAGRVLHKRS